MHNKGDCVVSVSHALEIFTALRRLKRKVWMVQYNDEGHVIDDPNNKMDFNIRQEQFFGYYLKGDPPPLWMTCGDSAEGLKERLGLKLDQVDAVP